MIRKSINDSWEFSTGSETLMSAFMGGQKYHSVMLPHDAMIHEKRTKETGNGNQTGFWPGGCYTYKKKIEVPEEWKNQTVMLEFEGVYETAMVYINDELAETNLYGYSNFYVVMDKYLNYGQINEIKVIANNAAEKNTRWYSGSGIYRNVHLLTGAAIHIRPDGLKISTPDVAQSYSVVELRIGLKNLLRDKEQITVKTSLCYKGTCVGCDTTDVMMFSEAEEEVCQRIGIADAKLWNVDTPELYDCTVQIFAGEELLDEVKEHFGIRKLALSAAHGLSINGVNVKLRGSCIHHDNGVIGAATLAKAEERRCRQLKEAGFNSIRSAHHPMSKAMLDACDKYGVLVMDELSDMWTKHKNPNDFALHFSESADREVARMVAKDYNHPSVILYSTGNEIPEIGNSYGAQMNRHLSNLFHRLDNTRYTTNAINGMLALGPKLGLIISDLMKNQKPQGEEGANALNGMMAIMTGPGADALACHPVMTEAIKESSEAMDIIGLNYLTGRHVLEKELHPNKCVLGTETYPADIVRLWSIVKNNEHVLGDYTWTGYDYIGEAGCGIFYYDGNMNFAGVYPDRLAYIGDINILGYRRPISYLRETVFGLRSEPYIAVERVDKYGMEHSKTAWMDKDNIASWTWSGFEGKPVKLDVYSADEEVELFLNGKSLGRKPSGEKNGFIASYELTYEPGELMAVGFADGKETGKFVLHSAENNLHMQVNCEGESLQADGEDLAFLTVTLTDDKGNENLFEEKEITVNVEGKGILQGYGNADPRAEGSYDDVTWRTYDGQVMAVVRAGFETGEIKVTFTAEGMEPCSCTIKVE